MRKATENLINLNVVGNFLSFPSQARKLKQAKK